MYKVFRYNLILQYLLFIVYIFKEKVDSIYALFKTALDVFPVTRLYDSGDNIEGENKTY